MKTIFNKGFTLIELLIVIAIIGILSSVVLAQLSEARSKGIDSSVKSALARERAAAANLFDNGYNGYQGICNDNAIKIPHDAAVASAGNGGTCVGTAGVFVDWIGLKTDTTKAWCVDYLGASKQITKPTLPIVSC